MARATRAGLLSELEADIVEIFVGLAGVFGLPRSYGEIYGLLYASPRPLSFTDIQEKLELSKGSISQGLRALREVGAIRPAEGGDERREHFVPETELRKLIAGFLGDSIIAQMHAGAARVDAIRAKHRGVLGGKSEDSRALHARVDKLQAWHKKGGTLLPLLSKFLR